MGVFSYRNSTQKEKKTPDDFAFFSSLTKEQFNQTLQCLPWKLKLGFEKNTSLDMDQLGRALNKGSMVRLPDMEVAWFLLKPEVVGLEVGELVQPEKCRSWQLCGLALTF